MRRLIMFEALLKEKNMSVYQCAKLSGIPYTTVSELVNGKTRLEKCTAETVYRLSKVLGVSMEDLLDDTIGFRYDFEVFRSNINHKIKDTDEIDFIIETLKNDDVGRYWRRRWYPEAFYLLASIDYLSRTNEIPLCSKYDYLRSYSLEKAFYPRDVRLYSKLNKDADIEEACKAAAIPEFARFNIMESELGNVY